MRRASIAASLLAVLALHAANASTAAEPPKPAAAPTWNLDDLPAYEPGPQVTGTIRSYGFAFGGVLEKWQKGFQKHHPHVTFGEAAIEPRQRLSTITETCVHHGDQRRRHGRSIRQLPKNLPGPLPDESLTPPTTRS